MVAQGNNSGGAVTTPTSIRITTDAFTGNELRNNTRYYFGVQPYAYNEFSSPNRIFQAPITNVSAQPSIVGVQRDGTVLNADAGAGLTSTPSATTSGQGIISARINNPAALTGATYRVEFFRQFNADGSVAGETEDVGGEEVFFPFGANYRIINVTTGEVVIDGQEFFDRTGQVLPQTDNVASADGITFSINGPAPGLAEFALVANADGFFDNPQPGSAAFGGYPTPTFLSPTGIDGGGSPTVDLQADGSEWLINYLDELIGDPEGNDYLSFLNNTVELDEVLPYSWEIRFTERGSMGFAGFGINQPIPLPFELWNIGIGSPDDMGDDVQCYAVVVDQDWVAQGRVTEFNLLNDASATSTFGFAENGDSLLSGGLNDPYTDSFTWECPTVAAGSPTPGSGFYNEAVALNPGGAALALPDGAAAPFSFMNFVAWNEGLTATGAYSDDNLPETGSIFRISSFVPNQPGDSYTISTEGLAVTTGQDSVRTAALDLIAITPNPYRGASGYEASGDERIARIVNLPSQATIRMFTLNGTLIRTIEKVNNGQTTVDWDLTTEAGLQIASGIYLIHIDARDSSGTSIGERVLKFAVVQRRVQLDVF